MSGYKALAGGYGALAEPETVLITGASSGLGQALAQEFGRLGYKVLASGRNEPALEALGAAGVYPLDLSTPGAGEELHRRVAADGHRVDILVCNAGLGLAGPFLAQPPEDLAALLAVNLGALTALDRLFGAEMVQRGGGRILNVASTGAWQPGPYQAAYYASKSYVLSLSRALGAELRGSGVTVTALCPGAVRSRFSQRSGRREPRHAMDPQRVAEIALRGLLRGREVVVPGAANKALHAASKVLPAGWMARLVGRYQKGLLG